MWSMSLTNSTSDFQAMKCEGGEEVLRVTDAAASSAQPPWGCPAGGRLASCSQGSSEAATAWVEKRERLSELYRDSLEMALVAHK